MWLVWEMEFVEFDEEGLGLLRVVGKVVDGMLLEEDR